MIGAERAGAAGLVVAALLGPGLAGCAGGPGTAPVELGSLTLPDGAIGATLTPEELRSELMAFADLAMSEMARVGSSGRDEVDPGARAYLGALQADVAATALAIAVEPDVEGALLDLMVSMAAKRMSVDEDSGLAADEREAVEASLGLLEEDIWSLGRALYAPGQLTGLQDQIREWQRGADGGRSFAGVVRADDLPPSKGEAISKGLFGTVGEAVRQLEESRLLGERVLFMAERLPTVAAWQAEATAWEVLAAPESRRTIEAVAVIASTLERLAHGVDSLPALLEGEREAFLAAFDEREATMGGLVADVGGIVREAGPIVDSGERLAGLSTEALERLNETVLVTERLIAALRDEGAPGGSLSLDVADYETALGDFRAAAEALSLAVERAEGMHAWPTDLIDRVAWRVAQLVLLVFVLASAYRWALPRLLRRRAG